MAENRDRPRGRSAFPWILGLAVVLGAWLRFDQLLAQIPADDEWHALRAVWEHDFAWIFTHFGISDYSIPLALYDELLANTIGLGELGLRLPMLAGGLATIVLVPVLVRPLVGGRAAGSLALLIATSPMLVYFSRYARPYAPATLAAVCALIAAWRWREEGGGRWAGLYAAGAVLAVWLLPVYGPLVAAPGAFLFAEGLLRPRRAPHAASRVLLLGLLVGLALAALLGPALLNDFGSLTDKMAGRRGIDLETLRQVASLYSGTGDPRLWGVVLAAAFVGGLVVLRRAPLLVAFVAWALLVQLAVLVATRPDKINSGITCGRYLLPFQPLLLLAVAVALGELDRLLRLPAAVPVGALALGSALFVDGPLPGELARPNDFTNHAWHQYYYDAESRAGLVDYWGRHRQQLPPFYLQLAELEPGSVHLLETPWFYSWHRIKLREAQAVHHQHVAVGFLGRDLNLGNELPLGGEFRFRTFVDVGDYDEIVRRGFDYVVFHNDLTRELKKSAPLVHIRLGTHLEEYRARFGPPVYEDKRLTVFAVR